MDLQTLVHDWFEKWDKGDFLNLPISQHFIHISPYGTIRGKDEYVQLVSANKDKFLGHRFELHDELYEQDKACVRYTAIQGDFRLEATEWYFPSEDGLIEKIISYYNIPGEVREDRKLSDSGGYEL